MNHRLSVSLIASTLAAFAAASCERDKAVPTGGGSAAPSASAIGVVDEGKAGDDINMISSGSAACGGGTCGSEPKSEPIAKKLDGVGQAPLPKTGSPSLPKTQPLSALPPKPVPTLPPKPGAKP